VSASLRDRLGSDRNRELGNLALLALLAAAGFTSVLVARSGEVSRLSLIYAGAFIALFVAAHAVMRIRVPNADSAVLPIVGVLAMTGLVEIQRIDPDLARDQALWLALGVLGFAVVLMGLRDYRTLEQYRYLLGATAIGLLLVTVLYSYAFDVVINGARLWIRAGGVQVQPGEFAKLALILFLASFLRERRELLAATRPGPLGIGLPPARHFAPLLAMSGGALLVLVAMNDFGTSLLFFGVFVAMVYVATGRAAYAAAGVVVFAAGSLVANSIAPQVGQRLDIWLDPWADPQGGGYQIVQSLYSIAEGGVFGAGIGRGYVVTGEGVPVIPAVQTDFIYSAIAAELGLAGAAGVLLLYLLLTWRGLKIAAAAGDGFSKLLATGITFTLAFQAFLIVGGVVRLVPLTGITLPFVSYGGSSMLANWIALALLLAISDRSARVAGHP